MMKKTNIYLMMLALAVSVLPMLTSCDEDDQYLASQLRNKDWQGYIGTYYSDRWGLSGENFNTVMRFTSKDSWYTSGRGEELDYSTRSRYDYAYCTFKWFIVDGEITLIYDDDKWQPIYIVDYSLNSSRFRGYIYDGTSRRIKFDLENTTYEDWGYYDNHTGGYGDFSHQNYYNSRTTPDFAAPDSAVQPPLQAPLVIDRTEQARQNSGEPDAVSIASGIFAERMR